MFAAKRSKNPDEDWLSIEELIELADRIDERSLSRALRSEAVEALAAADRPEEAEVQFSIYSDSIGDQSATTNLRYKIAYAWTKIDSPEDVRRLLGEHSAKIVDEIFSRRAREYAEARDYEGFMAALNEIEGDGRKAEAVRPGLRLFYFDKNESDPGSNGLRRALHMIDRVGEGNAKANLWFWLSDFLALQQPYYPVESPWLVTGTQNRKLLEQWRSDLSRAAVTGKSGEIIRVLNSFREKPLRGSVPLIPNETLSGMLKLPDSDLTAVYLASKDKPSLKGLSQRLQSEAERRAFEGGIDFERIRLIASFDLEPKRYRLLNSTLESIETGQIEDAVRAVSLLNSEKERRGHAVFLWAVLKAQQ